MSEDPTWPEVERRQASDVQRQAFDRGVEKAAELAAQNIAGLHRRRVLVQASVIVAVVVLAIMLPVSIVLHSNAVSSARANARYDCQLFTATASIVGDFVHSEAALRTAQNNTGLTKDIVAGFTKIIPIATLREAEAQNLRYTQRAVAAWNRDAQRLQALGASNCLRLGG